MFIRLSAKQCQHICDSEKQYNLKTSQMQRDGSFIHEEWLQGIAQEEMLHIGAGYLIVKMKEVDYKKMPKVFIDFADYKK